MFLKKLNPLVLLPVILLFSSSISAQEKKDTIYFDEDWSVCEKPVAEYYRVCILNKQNSIFYKGDVEDYYINGQIEMKGQYNDKGIKEGEFIFYSKNGNMLMKGNFLDNRMSGHWFFYNSSGKISTEINCKDEEDYTPLLIIDSKGDTILKNGNGKFILDMRNQLPVLFYGNKSFIIEGEVKDGLKDGEFNFYNTLPKKRLLFSETYKNGKFKDSKTEYSNVKAIMLSAADYQLNVTPLNLERIDQFSHTNLVFGYGRDAEIRLINFLANGEIPFIESRTKNTKENDALFFDLIGHVLYDTLTGLNEANDVNYKRFKYPVKTYYSAVYSKNQRNAFPEINASIILTIDTAGYIANSQFKSNLTDQQINKINYYFSRISNLAPRDNDTEKTMYNVNIKLAMLIDTLENDSFDVSYLIYNADSALEKDLTKYIDTLNISAEDYDKVFTSAQVEAKFPGDQNGWAAYLERNLNSQVPADHGAPPGNYTVTVSFLVDTTGKVSDVQALNDPGYGTAKEAIRVIENGPAWKPAIQNGRTVKYRQIENITFQVMK